MLENGALRWLRNQFLSLSFQKFIETFQSEAL
jgi:hypothetical protein